MQLAQRLDADAGRLPALEADDGTLVAQHQLQVGAWRVEAPHLVALGAEGGFDGVGELARAHRLQALQGLRHLCRTGRAQLPPGGDGGDDHEGKAAQHAGRRILLGQQQAHQQGQRQGQPQAGPPRRAQQDREQRVRGHLQFQASPRIQGLHVAACGVTRGGECFYHARRRALRRAAGSPPPLKPSRHHRMAQLLLWITPALWSSNYIIARASDGVIAPHALALGRWTLALALLLPLSGGCADRRFCAMAARMEADAAARRPGHVDLRRLRLPGRAHHQRHQHRPDLRRHAGGHCLGRRRKLLHERVSPLAARRHGAGAVRRALRRDQGRCWPTCARCASRVGDVWILAAALSWVAYTVLLQRWPSTLGPTPRLAAITFGGVLVLLPFTALEAMFNPGPALGAKALGLIVLAGLLPGFFSYQAYGYMLRELGAARSSLVMYLSPVYAAFTAWALLGEAPKAYHAVGAALILPAIYLATRKPAHRAERRGHNGASVRRRTLCRIHMSVQHPFHLAFPGRLRWPRPAPSTASLLGCPEGPLVRTPGSTSTSTATRSSPAPGTTEEAGHSPAPATVTATSSTRRRRCSTASRDCRLGATKATPRRWPAWVTSTSGHGRLLQLLSRTSASLTTSFRYEQATTVRLPDVGVGWHRSCAKWRTASGRRHLREQQVHGGLLRRDAGAVGAQRLRRLYAGFRLARRACRASLTYFFNADWSLTGADSARAAGRVRGQPDRHRGSAGVGLLAVGYKF